MTGVSVIAASKVYLQSEMVFWTITLYQKVSKHNNK